MKFKNLTLMLLFYFVILSTNAQFGREEIKKSKIVKDEVTLSIVDQNNLDLYIDSSNKTEKTLKESDYFQVKSNEFRLYANFVNPFEYIYKSSQKTLDDELFIASKDFLNSAASYISQVQSAAVRGRKTRPIANAPTENSLEPKLIEMYLLVKSQDSSFFLKNKAFWNSMVNLKLAKANENIANNYKITFDNLKSIINIDEINKTISNNNIKHEKNDIVIKELNNRFTNLKIEFEKIKFKPESNYLKPYIENVVAEIESDINELESLKTNVYTKYEKIKELFIDIFKRKHKLGINKFLISKIDEVESSKRHEISIVLDKISFNDSEKSIKIENSKTFIINVRKKTTFIPVLSSGILYTNLSFNQFGTDTNNSGETIITKTEDKDNEIAVAAYLNLYLNNNWNVPLFLQFGVGPSKEKPLFFLGGGLELTSRFTFSTGAVFTWMPQLNSLNVGDVVGGSSVINDNIVYEFDLNPKFYLGISIDITNK